MVPTISLPESAEAVEAPFSEIVSPLEILISQMSPIKQACDCRIVATADGVWAGLVSAAHPLSRLPTLLLERLDVLLNRLGCLREHFCTLLTVSVMMLPTLLGTGMEHLLKELEELLGVPRVPWNQREGCLAEFRNILAESDALRHVRISKLNALISTPLTRLNRPCDFVDHRPLLGRLHIL